MALIFPISVIFNTYLCSTNALSLLLIGDVNYFHFANVISSIFL